MSFHNPTSSKGFVARASTAERIPPTGTGGMHLMLDGSATGDAMSIVRSELSVAARGPGPHTHKGFSELLYVSSGSLDVLADDAILTLMAGDLVVVPPLMVHAFGASIDSAADVLVVIAPGFDRFEYFRQMSEATSFPPPLEFQERFDNYFTQSEIWTRRSSWESRD